MLSYFVIYDSIMFHYLQINNCNQYHKIGFYKKQANHLNPTYYKPSKQLHLHKVNI